MEAAALHPSEEHRLRALQRLSLLDGTTEAIWTHIAELASTLCDTPVALVTAVGKDRQEFKANVGLEVDHTGRAESFCGHAILEHNLFSVQDAATDVRFSDNPLVKGAPFIRFYAGVPVHMPDGLPMGTVCVIDRKPRRLTKSQAASLKLLAVHAEELLVAREAAVDLRVIMDTTSKAALQVTVNDLSHDLGTPLTPIMARLHLLEKMELPAPMRRHVDDLSINVRRLVKALRSVSAKLLVDRGDG